MNLLTLEYQYQNSATIKMDHHKIKSFDKKTIEALNRVEETEAEGFKSRLKIVEFL